MAGRDRGREDFDGVRVTPRPRRARGAAVAVVLGVAAVAVLVGVTAWRMHRGATDAPDTEVASASTRMPTQAGLPDAAAGDGGPGTAPVRTTRAAGRPSAATGDGEDRSRTLADYVRPGEAPTMREVIDTLHARGIRTGLGAFNPPGTSPPLRGIEVPEGFALPEGYVRHHQATDDGQTIAPILMFSPDIDSIVVGGTRVRIPANRVVPPELAPPGMPLRIVTIPPPRDGGPSP